MTQYIVRDYSNLEYWDDYAGGHGTHVAGTIAGKNDDGAGDPESYVPNDYFTDCADAIATLPCAQYFCPTCSLYPGMCDATCGYNDLPDGYASSDNTGMCPDCKLMAWDFGDDSGGLNVPSDYYSSLFYPAYVFGARISSNSWGGGNTYTYGASELDRCVTF